MTLMSCNKSAVGMNPLLVQEEEAPLVQEENALLAQENYVFLVQKIKYYPEN